MPNIYDLRESRFITQHDVNPAVVVTIKSFEQIDVAMPGVEPEYRWCVWFEEMEKPMTLNSTNGRIISAIIGSEELNDGIGKEIVLYQDSSIIFGGRTVGGIRVRAPKPGYKSAKSKPEREPEPESVDDDDSIPF